MTDDLYYRKLESISTTDLVDMIRERDGRIEELENTNTKISTECHKLVDSLEQKQNRIKELEKHNEEVIALIHAERERQEKCDDVHLRTITELEKENANLKALRKYELNVAKLEIEKLEKENAELRTKTTALENANRAMVKELDDMTSGGVSVLENVVRSKEQLTKAKKIIKNLMVFAEIDSREYEKEYKEAEQFLKEVSE